MAILRIHEPDTREDAFGILTPPGMTEWSREGFQDFLEQPTRSLSSAGFLPRPLNDLRHEVLRELMCHPERTLHPTLDCQPASGKRWEEGSPLDLPPGEGDTVVLNLQKKRNLPTPSWKCMDLASRTRGLHAGFEKEFTSTMERLVFNRGFTLEDLQGRLRDQWTDVQGSMRTDFSSIQQARMLLRLAAVVHAQPFENMSRFLSPARFRQGLEVWENFTLGFGGVCAEKTSALKAVCDLLGWSNRVVAGIPHPAPKHAEQQILETLEGKDPGAAPLRTRHLLLEVDIEDQTWLVDTTGGNMPLVCIRNPDRFRLMQAGYRARLVSRVDHLDLVSLPALAGEALLIVQEFHLPRIRWDLVFEQELGLSIGPDHYVGAFFDAGGEQGQIYEMHFHALARRLGARPPVFLNDSNASHVVRDAWTQQLETTRQAMLQRYPDSFYTGSITLVLQELSPRSFWRRPWVDPELVPHLNACLMT